jgi:hypothetical protein
MARPLKPLPIPRRGTLGERGLGVGPVGGQGEVLERREVAAGLELEVTHLVLGGEVHERSQLGLGRLVGHARAGVALEPCRGPRDQQLTLSVVEGQRQGQRRDLWVVGVLVQRHADRIEVGELDRPPDESRIDRGVQGSVRLRCRHVARLRAQGFDEDADVLIVAVDTELDAVDHVAVAGHDLDTD